MINLIENKTACFGCGACEASCAQGAISMVFDAEGFSYPVIDSTLCVECGNCISVCPAKYSVSGPEGAPFAVRSQDDSLLYKSTSGGAFSLFAEEILKENGVVCGAVFDENFRVHHILSDDISSMRKAKYVQSDLHGMYASVQNALASGKQVLFTGTPCQCDAMLRYFKEKPENLILMAIVCRGVQSPGVWKDYISYLSKEGKLESYCFRDKRVKNDAHTVSFSIDGRETALDMKKDRFCRIYLKCISLRPSCYQCAYTRWELPFDFTVGDFWGIEKEYHELADGKGTSLVIARTEKAMALIDKIKSHAIILETSREKADQPALNKPAPNSILRKLLFDDYSRKNENGVCDIPLILKKYGG